MVLKKLVYLAVLEIVVGVVSLGVYAYNRMSAVAAVNVRPDLAHAGFIDASLTGHGMDWVYYHYPDPMIAVHVAVMALVGIAALWVVVTE